MKKNLSWIISLLISLITVFVLFIEFNLYTIGDIPTKLVLIRYIASSMVGAILLVLFKKFIDINREKVFMLISGFTLIPFILYFTYSVLLNVFPSNTPSSSAGGIGIFILFLFVILSIPCFILSIISLFNNKDKKTRTVSIISLVLWGLVIFVEIRQFI